MFCFTEFQPFPGYFIQNSAVLMNNRLPGIEKGRHKHGNLFRDTVSVPIREPNHQGIYKQTSITSALKIYFEP